MFTTFSELLFLTPLSATLIRSTLAIVMAHSAWKHTATSTRLSLAFAIVEAATAVLLFVGAIAQPAALAAAFVLTTILLFSQIRTLPRSTILLALAMSLSVLVTGAGAIAFDLPL